MLDLIRASALQGYEDLVRDLGADPTSILASEKLAAGSLGDSDTYVPFRTVARIVDRTARDLRCPDFSLRLAARQSIEILGPIALIARFSPTARSALDEISNHMSQYSPALAISVAPGVGPESIYEFGVLVPGIPLEQIYQLGLGVSLGIFRLLMGARFNPLDAAFPLGIPANARDYEHFFGCPVRFGANYCGMRIASDDLDRRRSDDDPSVREYVTRYLNAASPPAGDVVGHVRHLIDRTLATGHANTTGIATHLGVHPRTLHRWLGTYETTFEQILDNVRREKALRLLSDSSLPVSHVSSMLGYSQQSCLSRACARWFNMSPRELRRAAGSPSTRHQ